jgi:hypothetical protein
MIPRMVVLRAVSASIVFSSALPLALFPYPLF